MTTLNFNCNNKPKFIDDKFVTNINHLTKEDKALLENKLFSTSVFWDFYCTEKSIITTKWDGDLFKINVDNSNAPSGIFYSLVYAPKFMLIDDVRLYIKSGKRKRSK